MAMVKIRYSATNIIRSILFITLAVAGPVVSAQENPGWYIGAETFYSKYSDTDGTLTQTFTTTVPTTTPCLLGVNPLPAPLNINLLPSPLPCLLGSVTTNANGTSTSTTPTSFAFSSGYAVGLNLGYAYSSGLRPELNFNYSKSDIERIVIGGVNNTGQDDRIKAYRFMANVWYDIGTGTNFSPYIGGGIGLQRSELELGTSRTSNAFAYQLGAGLNWWFTKKTSLSLDYRFASSKPSFDLGSGSSLEQKLDNHQIGLGLKYLFKGEFPSSAPAAEEAPAPAAVVQVQDSDGDGVIDDLDKCPGTPAGTPVDANGCPSKDSDGDGVTDDKDKCPNTPAGQKVGADGCPLDSDGDGIPDDVDECPNSPAGAKVLPNGCALKGDCHKPKPGEPVDENGCGLNKNFLLKGVKFEFDSDRLTPESKEILNGVAETLKAYPEVNVEVSGHTDYVGTDAYNLALSEHRANAVKTYLEGRGVEGKRMMPVGYGKTVPIDTNDSEEGRENNRRVEFKVRD